MSVIFVCDGMECRARRFMWKGKKETIYSERISSSNGIVVLTVIARMSTQDAHCSVILTTHSMEEAEALCTRIGISKEFVGVL